MIMENNNQNDKQNQPNLCQQIMEKLKQMALKCGLNGILSLARRCGFAV